MKVSWIAAAAVVLSATPAASAEGADYLEELLNRAGRALDEAASELAPKPPVAVPLSWRAKSRGAFEVDGTIVAVEAADLDGDKRQELIALTTERVYVFRPTLKKAVTIIAEAPLPDVPAIVRSRDPVGTISIEGGADRPTIAVRTSEQAHGAIYSLSDGNLSMVGPMKATDGFPLCDGVRAELVTGKNMFAAATLTVDDGAWPASVAKPQADFYRLECRTIIGVDGRRNRTIAVTGPAREVAVHCVRKDKPCSDGAVSNADMSGAGVAVEVADLNRDGRAEVASSLGKAPGTDDRIRVHGVGGKLLRSRKVSAAVLAISAVDVAGDGRRQLFFALRLKRDKRLHLWTLNRHR